MVIRKHLLASGLADASSQAISTILTQHSVGPNLLYCLESTIITDIECWKLSDQVAMDRGGGSRHSIVHIKRALRYGWCSGFRLRGLT